MEYLATITGFDCRLATTETITTVCYSITLEMNDYYIRVENEVSKEEINQSFGLNIGVNEDNSTGAFVGKKCVVTKERDDYQFICLL